MENKIRYTAKATGKVQGVGLRQFVSDHAHELNVTGWIRNMEDGSVRMEVQGTAENVQSLADEIRKGNYYINVEKLEVEKMPLVPDEQTFSIEF